MRNTANASQQILRLGSREDPFDASQNMGNTVRKCCLTPVSAVRLNLDSVVFRHHLRCGSAHLHLGTHLLQQ
jgi:hypothetical protein